MMARIVYWFVGYVLWRIIGRKHNAYDLDCGHQWEAHWWIFSEYGDYQFNECTRVLGKICVSACYWENSYILTKGA